MPGFELKTIGLAALKKRLDQVATKDAERMMNKALRAGGRVFETAIEERAPERPDLPSGTALPPGALRRDISVRRVPSEPRTAVVVIGPGKYTKQTAHLVEFGHRNVRGGKSRIGKDGKAKGEGQVIGQVPAHPFVRPAFEAAGQQALDAVKDSLTEDFARLDSKGGN